MATESDPIREIAEEFAEIYPYQVFRNVTWINLPVAVELAIRLTAKATRNVLTRWALTPDKTFDEVMFQTEMAAELRELMKEGHNGGD